MSNEELIALYFDGQLSNPQKDRFNRLLETDPDFKAQVVFERQVKKAIMSTKTDALREKLKSLEQPKKKSNHYFWLAIAASIVVAVGIFTFLKPSSEVSNKELFETYFEPYANVIAPTTRGDVYTVKNEAFINYENSFYREAREQFSSLYVSTKEPYYLFYQAMCDLQLDKTESAISSLSTLQELQFRLSPQVTWYLALAYLKTDQNQKAKAQLKKIIEEKHYKHQSAEELLKKID